jgi:hypothetical protein
MAMDLFDYIEVFTTEPYGATISVGAFLISY